MHAELRWTDRGDEPRGAFLRAGERLRIPAWLALLAFTLAIRFVSILSCELSGRDEPRVAGIAREMVTSGDWLVPRLNGRDFLEYPPLGYYPIALFLSLSGGPSEALSVIPVALLGAGTVLLTYLLGKKLAGERVGLAAGFILAATMGFFILHRRCLVDPALLFFVTLSLYGFAAGIQDSRRRFRWFALFYLGMAGGFLSKGLIGIGIPAATALAVSIARRDLFILKDLRPVRGALLFLLPIALWAGGLWLRAEPGLFEEVVEQSLRRFLSPSADHAGPIHYYIVPALTGLLPWTPLPLALLALWLARRLRGDRTPPRPLTLFALIWSLTVFIGLSAASAKRTLYLGPIYPPFALLSGLAWIRLREEFPKTKRCEVPVLAALLLSFGGFHFLKLLPQERQDSYRPVFEAAAGAGKDLPVYLYNPSEALRGAAVFYLGKKVPVLERDPAGWPAEGSMGILVASSRGDGEPFLASLPSRGFSLVFQERIGSPMIQVYSNTPGK